MKSVPVFLVLLGSVLATDYCNPRNSSAACGHVQCGPTQQPGCDRYLCTCIDKPTTKPPSAVCVSLSDCDTYWTQHSCPSQKRHCIDRACECKSI